MNLHWRITIRKKSLLFIVSLDFSSFFFCYLFSHFHTEKVKWFTMLEYSSKWKNCPKSDWYLFKDIQSVFWFNAKIVTGIKMSVVFSAELDWISYIKIIWSLFIWIQKQTNQISCSKSSVVAEKTENNETIYLLINCL